MSGQVSEGSSVSDEQHSWVSQFTGIDTKAGAGAASPNGGAEPSGGGFFDSIASAAHSVADGVSSAASSVGHAVADTASTVGHAVADTASTVGHAVGDAASAVGHAVADTATTVGHAVGDAASTVGHAVADTATTVGHAVGDAASAVGHAVADTAKTVGHTVVDAATKAEHAVVDGVKAVGHAISETASKAVEAAKKAFEPPPPIKRGEVGPAQKERADKLLEAMPPEEQKKVKKLIDDAPPAQKGYLEKALASKHSAAELEEFSKQIAGKDQAWLDEKLHLVGQSEGKGIKQQWHDSCGPTTIQAMKGELDPIYALKLRTDNEKFTEVDEHDATKLNPTMAEEQRKILVDNKGNPVNRDSNGKGMPLTDALNDQKATTGLKFDIEAVDDKSVDSALGDVDGSLKSGLPVPMRLGNDKGGHFVLITAVDPGPPRSYAIHDPWDGKIVNVTDEQIKKKNFKIAGYNQMTHIYKPSADPSAGAGS